MLAHLKIELNHVVYFYKNALLTPHLHNFDNLRTFSANLLGMKTVTVNLFAFSMHAKQGRLLGTLTASLTINFTLFYTFPMFLLSKTEGYPSPQTKKVQLTNFFLTSLPKRHPLESYFCKKKFLQILKILITQIQLHRWKGRCAFLLVGTLGGFLYRTLASCRSAALCMGLKSDSLMQVNHQHHHHHWLLIIQLISSHHLVVMVKLTIKTILLW